MRSRIGKKTEYDFAILREAKPDDMIKVHRRHMRKMEARGPYKHVDPGKIGSDDEDDLEDNYETRDAIVKPKTDLNSYIKKFTQQKAMAFTSKSKPKGKREGSAGRIKDDSI